MHQSPSHLPAEVLFVEGPDAGTFMQNQFTSDVLSLHEGAWQFSAWLDAQGRTRALFQLARLGVERWAMLLRGGRAEAIRQDLARYVFRSRVSMRAHEGASIAQGSPMPLHAAEIGSDDRLILGCGEYRMETAPNTSTDTSWRRAQIHAGWPWLSESALDRYTPPSLGLHQLGAIALDKGCYPGQEIVARLHYRGGNKRRLCNVELLHQDQPGDALHIPEGDADLHVLDAVREGATFRALAVAHAEWIDRSTEELRAEHGDSAGVRLIHAWTA